MTYKTKIGIAIGVGFGFIIVMAIVMAVFVSNNSGSQLANTNKSQNIINSISDDNTNTNSVEEQEVLSPNSEIELNIEDVNSLAIKENENEKYLLKISNDLESEDVVNLENISGFCDYDYLDESLYIAFNKTENLLIYSIDLNDNTETLFETLESNFLNSFYICNKSFYYVTTENSIYEYNIELGEGEEIIIPEANETIVNIEIDKNNNDLYYMKNVVSENNTSTYVYKYNLETRSEEELIKAEVKGQELVLYKDYLVCNLLNSTDDGDYSSNYIYNLSNGSLWELGSKKQSTFEEKASGNVSFLDNYIAFSDGEKVKITDYDGNIINENLYSVSEGNEILDIISITNDKLQIRTDENEETVKIIDFNSSTIENSSNYYYDILKIK